MANELVVSFLRGPKANLANKEKSPGQVLFVLNNDNTGSIYYDENASTRYRMSYDLKDTTNKFTISAAAVSTTANRVYPVALDKDGYLAVCVPWSNTTYSAGTGLSLTGTQFKNTGVISVATGSTNGSISVKTGDANAVDVSVKGLKDLAYIAKDGASSTKFLKGDGTWAVPTDHTYNAGIGLTLSGSTFKAKLKSETAATNDSATPGNTSGRQYAVVADKSGYLSVNVPWVNDNTTYSASNKGITLASGNVFTLSLVSDTTASEAATTAGTASSKYYPVGLDKNSKLVVNVPWSNTTYTASSPITLTGTQFTINDGAISNAKLANHKITVAEREIQLGGEASSNEIGSSPFVIGTQTAATGTWKGNVEFTSLVDGQQITYWLPFAGSGNATLTLTYPDGSTTAALPCYYGGTTRLTTHYAAGSIIRFTYRENVTIGSTTIAAGWWADANYDSGNTNDSAGYLRYFQNAAYVKPTTALYRYLILFSKGDGEHVIPANTTSNSTANTKTTITTEAFNVFEPIYYYSTTGTVNANANIDGRYFWFMRSDINLNYSFNIGSTLTAYKDVYLVATLETPVTAKLRNPGLTGTNAAVGGDGPITQTLPTTEDGYIYIKLGHAYSTSNIILTPDHPIYEFKNGHLRRYEYDEYTASNKGIILDDYTFKLKLQSETALTGAAGTATNTTNKYYPVALDSNGNLAVNIPWSNTTYSAGTGLSLTGTTFANTGIITLAVGTSNGQTKVNGTDTTIVKGLADLAYISKDGASSTKFLKGDGTWATPTDHTYNAGIGLTLSGSTFKAKLKSETAATNDSATPVNTANRQYAVVVDKSGYLSVNVPWANDNTTYSASNNGITLESGNVFTLSLVSNTTASEGATTAGTTSGKYYPVGLDKNKKLVVNVPWSNTTYTAGTGLSLTGTQFANTGIVTLAVGTNNGQTKVNGTDTTIVKGLSDLAYIAKDGSSSTKFLKGDGTWAVPTDHTYNAGIGLTLSGSTFKAKLKSETAATNDSATPGNTTNRQYAVVVDKSGYLSVNVPWANDNTTYSASNKGITLTSGNVFTLSLVSDTAASENATTAGTATGKYYPVGLDKNSKLVVNVPWSNTTYTAGTGLSLTGTQFTNTGIVTLAVGTNNGQTKVNGTDTTIVKGLADLAYIAKDGASSTKFLKGDGTWAVPTDHTYNAGIGLTLSGSTFKAKLKSETAATNDSATPGNTANRQYAIVVDKSGYLSVNIPWVNDNTTYSASNKGITLASGNVFTLSLVSDTAASEGATTAGTATGKYYPVGLDKNSKLVVNVPWSNTTYTAGVGLTLSGTQFKAKLKTETAFTADSAAQTNTANRQYMVGVDKSGYLSVNVPWTDTDTNTDTKVTQSGVADNSELPIILKYTANTTSETTTVKYNSNSTAAKQTTVNPSTGTVSANIFRVATKVKLEYDATTESLNFVFI